MSDYAPVIREVEDRTVQAVLEVLSAARVMSRSYAGEFMAFDGVLAIEVFEGELDKRLGRR